jgi:hypothetical protein
MADLGPLHAKIGQQAPDFDFPSMIGTGSSCEKPLKQSLTI